MNQAQPSPPPFSAQQPPSSAPQPSPQPSSAQQLLAQSPAHPSWLPILTPALEAAWHDIAPLLEEDNVLPAREDIFAAFAVPVDEVRVVIVGQDPYPTPGHPMGLSFSTQPGVAPPRSLVNIYRELGTDLGIAAPADGDLRPWLAQGVMLLNRVLTVRAGEAGSHRRHGWEAVTEAALRALNRAPMVAILWGKDAQACAKFLPAVPTVESAHPSPLSARRGFFGSRPFTRANELLVAQGGREVDWRLP